ncbi:DUF4249 domain-containing protein [Hymenobacter metallilatus]|nr:DUF4249 domain-containing protein [Hymenobacter metallilatus]
MPSFLRISLLSLWLALGLSSCVQEYLPTVISEEKNYLVVDGFINGNGITSISLTRSLQLSAKGPYPPETRATVFVESAGGQRYALMEATPGVYASPAQQLPANQNYRLYIRTATGREYASDFTLLKTTPAIDALGGRPQAGGLQLYISAHDDRNLTQYYRWQYEETWEFTSAFRSTINYVNNQVVPRTENIYNCWRTEKSTSLNTTSTVRLSQDAVRDYRLLFIPATSGRLHYTYSVLVRQYALSQAEFDYWEAVKKNTENIGTLFDPLPSQIQGNVHSLTDAQEPVLGFVGAATVVEKRIFIKRTDLPNEWPTNLDGYETCVGLDSFPSDRWKGLTLQEYFSNPTERIPVSKNGNFYTSQSPECVDCRLRGTPTKPSFWP